ncbi:hypothetical protein RJ639_027446 [Escallonia herrerae]|uniref:Protein SirB1 N-terminal domain-containing protein n=1 Tax=Escallonia herrerae TaxID=1293975 RepID=A0AA88X323_9ASTE|nr:hypothetical protein RJ639_027446 [Escallonia herrerae]
MSGLASPWILGAFHFSLSSSPTSDDNSRFAIRHPCPCASPSPSYSGVVCRYKFAAANHLKFVLHDALDSAGTDTTHARAARDGFCSQIKNLSDLEREISISINKEVDLGKTALFIAAEDDSLISHSSVPLPVDAFIDRLDSLSMGYCSQYSSSLGSSPEAFLECLNRYLYVNRVLTHRLGSASMLSLLYSEILKLLHLWGLLNFDVEVFFPHDSHSSPRGYLKQKSKEADQPHILTSQSLLVKILRDLKDAFWPFQLDHTRSLFLRAAEAANCSDRSNNVKESAFELASVKAAQHRLERGVWTSVRFGDMRRALSACERLIILETDLNELRDYGALLYHCGFYEESLQYLKIYQDAAKSSLQEQPSSSFRDLKKNAVEKLMTRLNLIMMEEGWTRPSNVGNFLHNNSDPW